MLDGSQGAHQVSESDISIMFSLVKLSHCHLHADYLCTDKLYWENNFQSEGLGTWWHTWCTPLYIHLAELLRLSVRGSSRTGFFSCTNVHSYLDCSNRSACYIQTGTRCHRLIRQDCGCKRTDWCVIPCKSVIPVQEHLVWCLSLNTLLTWELYCTSLVSSQMLWLGYLQINGYCRYLGIRFECGCWSTHAKVVARSLCSTITWFDSGSI